MELNIFLWLMPLWYGYKTMSIMKTAYLILTVLLFGGPLQAGPLWEQLTTKFKHHHINPNLQGLLLVDAQGNILEHHQDQAPLPAASVTKLATTLAALDYWGVDHQFMTRIYANGPVVQGVLQGNLYLQGGADPLFLREDAQRLGQRLQQVGIERVAGDLVVVGPFWMSFNTNPLASARAFRIRASLRITGAVRQGEALPSALREALVEYPSLPLWKITKRMNAYSTNSLAVMLGAVVGGPVLLNQQLRSTYHLLPMGLQVQVPSGLGRENKISPQTVLALIDGLSNRMGESGRTLGDVMAVKGRDPGTLKHRAMPTGVIAKTGTLNGVSCLAGVIETSQGPFRFVMLNQGPVHLLRNIQDWFLQGVQRTYGPPTLDPWVSDGFFDERTLQQ